MSDLQNQDSAIDFQNLVQQALNVPEFAEYRAQCLAFFQEDAAQFESKVAAADITQVKRIFKLIKETDPQAFKLLKPMRTAIGLLDETFRANLYQSIKDIRADLKADQLSASAAHALIYLMVLDPLRLTYLQSLQQLQEGESNLKPNYPSGGPVSKMLNIWRAAAPSVDLIAPDIYVDDFKRVCRQYTILGNPLFIPELAPDIRQAAQIYYAIGNHQAICFAPFAIDGFKKEEAEQLAKVYHSLKGFLPLYAQKCSADNSIGFCFTNQDREQFTLGNYTIEVVYKQQRDRENAIAESAGMIFQIAENEFYILGHNIEVFFRAKNGGNAEFLSHDEGRFVDGKWIPRRRMNGDEMEIRIKEPDIRKVKFHIYD